MRELEPLFRQVEHFADVLADEPSRSRESGPAARVALAGQRMYLAKQAGRNRCVIDEGGEAYPTVASGAKGE